VTATEMVPEVEQQLARDMVRRGLPIAPVLVLVASLIWGVNGGLSAAYAIAIVFANLLLSAAMLAWAARKGGNALMAMALGGFLARMIVVTLAVFVVKDMAWVELVPLALAVLVTSTGLLFWETRYVSATLAFPGLRPGVGKGA
jgi:hypothetical protein